MIFNFQRYKAVGHCFSALILAAILLAGTISPAAAIDLNPANYLQLVYEPVTFDKTEIIAGETFYATFRGKASCTKSLPFSPSQVTIEFRIIAIGIAGGDPLPLNESYIISVDPIPHKEGETYEIDQRIPLDMPSSAAPGDYTVTAQLIEARVKILFVWQSVTGAFPKEQNMGTIKVIEPEQATPPAGEPPHIASESPALTTTPESPPPPAPATEPTTTPEPSQEQPESEKNRWVVPLLIVIVVVVTTAAILLIRYRKTER